MSQYRPTVLTVSLSAIAENFRLAKTVVHGVPRRMAVVKADAYGHGMLPVAKRLIREGADALAVATVDEGIALRDEGILAPTLIMGGTYRDGLAEAVRCHLALSVYDIDTLRRLDQAAQRLNTIAHAHLKIDTGMGRVGVKGEKALSELLDFWAQTKHVKMEGIFTHFANADGDPEYTALQNSRFLTALDTVRKAGYHPLAHASASTGMLAGEEYWHDMVRPGIMLYGAEVTDRVIGLTPAQTLSTAPVRLEWMEEGETVGYGRTFTCSRPTRVMTLPVGYGDGYPRILSNQADVLVCGRRAPIIGRICMDQLMVDVTDVPDANLKSEVVLMGAQGGERITPDELARLSGTIPYEIMLGFGARVTRRVVD
ncbi:MAG: alanine racemase [Clostridia bacterium]|nr:alanine racemase [Clostridia bacterium]